MNKVLFIASANISIPPMIPLIIYSSLLTGQLFVHGNFEHSQLLDFSSDVVQKNIQQYFIGATVLALIAFVVGFVISYLFLSLVRKNPIKQ